MSPTVSIVTPFLEGVWLIPDYERAACGADQVIVIDNGSSEVAAAAIAEMVARLGGVLIRRDDNGWFSGPVNDGIAVASGDVVVSLNNDVVGRPGWLDGVRRDVRPGALYGPSRGLRAVDGVHVPYIEGWCIAGRRETWAELGGFDAETYPRPYWEDVDLSFRAMSMGIGLYATSWEIAHLSNATSRITPGAYDASERNRQVFEARVRAHLAQRAAA